MCTAHSLQCASVKWGEPFVILYWISIEGRIEFQSFTEKKEMNSEKTKRWKKKNNIINEKNGKKDRQETARTYTAVPLLQFVFPASSIVKILYKKKAKDERKATCSMAWLRNDVCTFVLVFVRLHHFSFHDKNH